jgi:hypothetical protein
MASSISVRVEDRLEGASNFNVWKLRIMNILQEHDLEQYVTSVMEEPTFNHTYQNRTGTGKTGRSDRFTDPTGPNRPSKPLLTGSVRNRFFCPNRTGFFLKVLMLA